MKSKTGLIVLILIIVGIAIYGYFKAIPGAQNKEGNLPKIEISPESFDFGEIDYGQIVKQSFIIKNIGEEVLEIKRVATSCACTTAKAAQEIISPGQKTELLVTYDSGAMSGSHGRGDQDRIIYIKSNDPINPQIEVTISSYVK